MVHIASQRCETRGLAKLARHLLEDNRLNRLNLQGEAHESSDAKRFYSD